MPNISLDSYFVQLSELTSGYWIMIQQSQAWHQVLDFVSQIFSAQGYVWLTKFQLVFGFPSQLLLLPVVIVCITFLPLLCGCPHLSTLFFRRLGFSSSIFFLIVIFPVMMHELTFGLLLRSLRQFLRCFFCSGCGCRQTSESNHTAICESIQQQVKRIHSSSSLQAKSRFALKSTIDPSSWSFDLLSSSSSFSSSLGPANDQGVHEIRVSNFDRTSLT